MENENPLAFVTKLFADNRVVWDAERCAMLLGLAVGRIRLQRKKYREINENRKREVASLLQQEKEMQARVKAMAVIHEDYLAEVRDIVELYCERLTLRVDVMNVQKYIPVDCSELVNGVVYAATFMENSAELSKLREMFIAKYGPIHVDAVERGCVEDRILDRLSRAPPSNTLVDYYLGTIALQFEIDWTPPEVQIKDDKAGKEPTRANPPADLLLPSPQLKKEHVKSPSESIGKEKAKVEEFDIKGEVKADDNGNFWVFQLGFAAGEPPIFIPKAGALNAQPGNFVGVVLDKRTDGKRSGKIVVILGEKVPRYLRGTLLQDLKGNHWVKTDSQVLVFVAPKDLNGGVVNSEVLVQLHERSDGKLSGGIVEKPKEIERSLEGVLQVGSQGHHWVISSEITEPIFIAPADLKGARHDSRVIVALHNRTDGKFSGAITAVIDPTQAIKSMLHDEVPQKPHKKDQRSGEIFEDVNGHHWLINEGGNNPFALGTEPAVYIPRESLNGATSGDKVEVEVSPSPYALNSFIGQVSKVTHKSASRAVQVLGVLTIDPESGDGLVRNRENGSSVFIARADLAKFNESQRARARDAESSAASALATSPVESGDLVLVDAVETPNGHPKRGSATHIGALTQVVDKASLEFESTLHLSPSPHNPKLTVAFVDLPSDPSQRVIIEYEDLQGATDGSTVRVTMSRQFQNAQQKAVGKILRVVKLAAQPSASSSQGDGNGNDAEEYVDEFEALSAEWNRRKSKPISSPSSTPKGKQHEKLKPFAEVFVPLKSSEINFNDYLPPVVITCGSLNLRCGLSYDLENDALSLRPTIVDPLIIGRPLTSKFKMQTIGEGGLKETLVGAECSRRFGVLVLSRPVVNGVVVNWEDFEIALRHHFVSTLQVDVTRHPVIISTGSRNSDGLSSNQSDTANILKLMLSRFNAPLVSLQPEWKLISYAASEQTTLIVSIGDSVSYVAPIVNGKEIVFATKLLPVNGSMATERLIKLLGDSNVGRFESMSEQNAIRLLKEKHAFVRDVLIEDETISYEMPDGSTITVPTRLLADCVEVLFDPTLIGQEKDAGVVEAAFQSVLAVENTELRKSLLQNIVLCGGSAEIKRFGARFIHDLQALLATNEATLSLEAKLLYPKNDLEASECGNLVWRGACEIAAHNKECLWMKSK